MRAMILIAGAALALAACKNNDQADNSQNIDESLAAENIVSNDVTAIDAVTGDAANMAAESNIDEIPAANSENATATETTSQPQSKPKPKRAPATAKPDEPATNNAAAAPANSAE
jgi:hypothetical protein